MTWKGNWASGATSRRQGGEKPKYCGARTTERAVPAEAQRADPAVTRTQSAFARAWIRAVRGLNPRSTRASSVLRGGDDDGSATSYPTRLGGREGMLTSGVHLKSAWPANGQWVTKTRRRSPTSSCLCSARPVSVVTFGAPPRVTAQCVRSRARHEGNDSPCAASETPATATRRTAATRRAERPERPQRESWKKAVRGRLRATGSGRGRRARAAREAKGGYRLKASGRRQTAVALDAETAGSWRRGR